MMATSKKGRGSFNVQALDEEVPDAGNQYGGEDGEHILLYAVALAG